MASHNTDKIGTLIGFSSASLFIFLGILWPVEYSNFAIILGDIYETEDQFINILLKITRFFDIKSFFIVVGGTLSTTFIAFPYHKTIRSFKTIGKILSSDKSELESEHVFETTKSISDKRFNGKRITNDDLNSIENPLMRRWIENLIVREQVPVERLEVILNSEVEMYRHRADEEIEIYEFMSTAAPAFGMMGTVVGLVLMLAETGSIRAVMQSMSIAMLTTLYGVVISNLILNPLASKRKRLQESHQMLMEMVREGVIGIAKRDSPYTMLQELSLFLPEKRKHFDQQYR